MKICWLIPDSTVLVVRETRTQRCSHGLWWQINTLLVGPENSNSCAFIDRYLLIVYMNECSSDCFEYNGEQAIQEGRISFLGCLPVYDSAAARLAGRSDAWITSRIAELHMQAMDRAS